MFNHLLMKQDSIFPISMSLLGATILMLVALPTWLDYFRPQFVILTLLYWTLKAPQRIGIITTWCLGIFFDVLFNSVLGVHALAFVLVVYIALKWQVRFNFFAFWQKLIFILLLIILSCLPQLFVELFSHARLNVWLYLLPSLTSTLFWPCFVYLLDAMRRAVSIGVSR